MASEIRNYKEFNLPTKTSKGTFIITVKVYEQLISGDSFKNHWYMYFQASVNIDGTVLDCDFNRYSPNKVTSWAVSKHFGIEKRVTLDVDGSEPVKYANNIEKKYRDAFSKGIREQNERDNLFNKMHDL